MKRDAASQSVLGDAIARAQSNDPDSLLHLYYVLSRVGIGEDFALLAIELADVSRKIGRLQERRQLSLRRRQRSRRRAIFTIANYMELQRLIERQTELLSSFGAWMTEKER